MHVVRFVNCFFRVIIELIVHESVLCTLAPVVVTALLKVRLLHNIGILNSVLYAYNLPPIGFIPVTV